MTEFALCFSAIMCLFGFATFIFLLVNAISFELQLRKDKRNEEIKEIIKEVGDIYNVNKAK